jgi:hypothetical protein
VKVHACVASNIDIETSMYACISTVQAGWNVDHGGVTSYIAKDEDEEVQLLLFWLLLASAVMCSIRFHTWVAHFFQSV